MPHDKVIQLALILILGIAAQWLGWRLRVPSILLLLGCGFLAGPATGLIRPKEIFGDALPGLVSLSVAVILYEGGLNLRFRELRKLGVGFVLLRLVVVGALVSWALGGLALHVLFQFSPPVAALFGAVFVVTGPTVVGPMLRHLKLRGRVAALLKWEGIVVDPIGATLAVLVFTVAKSDVLHEGLADAALALGKTVAAGLACGCAAAALLIAALRRYWIPDALHNPVSLMCMLACFAGAEFIQAEAGLFAVTVMGIALANQEWVSVRHVVEFKETLAVLLLSFLFIALSADLRLDDLGALGGEGAAFVAVMMLVVRPFSVFAATSGTSLPWRDRAFLAWMAPRGIVAAAVSSVFAVDLVAAGYPRAAQMVPNTFLFVFVTVLAYGLSAGPLARRLGLIHPSPQGVLFVGAGSFARDMALALQKERIPVALVDTDRANVVRARMEGLTCHFGSALSETIREEIDFGGLGRLLATTANDEVNSLACSLYKEDFGRREVYQLPLAGPAEGRHEGVPSDQRGRILFCDRREALGGDPGAAPGGPVRKTGLSTQFDFDAFRAEHGASAIPLFTVDSSGALHVWTVAGAPPPRPGDRIVYVLGKAAA